MSKIFYLMGKSSSGKDTIYKRIMQHEEIQLKKVVPYTTRPIREGEREGVQYHFTDENGFKKLLDEGKVIEHRTYNTYHGEWKYFTVSEGINPDKEDYLIIGTPESYNATRKYYGEGVVVPILIDVDDGIRLQRALKREMKQEHPKYEEMCRRFLADSKDFSDENIKACGIERVFTNQNLDECINEVVSYIISMMQ